MRKKSQLMRKLSSGHQDLGYIGNVPLLKFDGPPVELLRKLGLVKEPA